MRTCSLPREPAPRTDTLTLVTGVREGSVVIWRGHCAIEEAAVEAESRRGTEVRGQRSEVRDHGDGGRKKRSHAEAERAGGGKTDGRGRRTSGREAGTQTLLSVP